MEKQNNNNETVAIDNIETLNEESIFYIRFVQRHFFEIINGERCPNCGGYMENGKCQEDINSCGYGWGDHNGEITNNFKSIFDENLKELKKGNEESKNDNIVIEKTKEGTRVTIKRQTCLNCGDIYIKENGLCRDCNKLK